MQNIHIFIYKKVNFIDLLKSQINFPGNFKRSVIPKSLIRENA